MKIEDILNLKEQGSTEMSKSIYNGTRHVVIRFAILILVPALSFLIMYFVDDGYALLLAFFISVGFVIIYILYLFIEALFLQSKYDTKFTKRNLMLMYLLMFINVISILYFLNEN